MATGLEDLRVLQEVEKIADEIWVEVIQWDTFSKDTVGKQLVRAVDSIGANIAEAYGRFHFGEKLRFLYYARGSLYETKYWLNRSFARHLIKDSELGNYAQQLNTIGRQLNNFANSLKSQQKNNKKSANRLRESPIEYRINSDGNESLFSEKDLNWLKSTTSGPEKSQISQPQVANLQSQE